MAMAAMRRGNVVVGTQVSHHSCCDGFFSYIEMHKAEDFFVHEKLFYVSLECPYANHCLEHLHLFFD